MAYTFMFSVTGTLSINPYMLIAHFSSSRKVVFALIETWPWAREELEMEMAKQATEDLRARQRTA